MLVSVRTGLIPVQLGFGQPAVAPLTVGAAVNVAGFVANVRFPFLIALAGIAVSDAAPGAPAAAWRAVPSYRLMVRPHPGLSGSGRSSRFTSRGPTAGSAWTVLVCSLVSPGAAFSRLFPALPRNRPIALRKRPIAGS